MTRLITDSPPLGECGGHFEAPAAEEGRIRMTALTGRPQLGECGGHFEAPAAEEGRIRMTALAPHQSRLERKGR